MRLHDLFKGSSPPPKKILSDATRALAEQAAGNLTLDAEGAQLVGKLLGQCAPKGGVTPEGLAAAAALARLIHAARKKGPVVQALLTGSFARGLCAAVGAAARALAAGRLGLEEAEEPVKQLMLCVEHLGGLGFKRAAAAGEGDADGWGAQEKAVFKVRGRVIMAGDAVPALLDALILIKGCEPGALEALLPTAKLAAEIMVSFACSLDGARALAGTPAAAAGAALDAVLSRCGDAALQLDLCEAMHSCIKAGAGAGAPGAAPTLHASALFKPLSELAFREAREEGVDLAAALRRVVVDFNRAAGKRALVASLAPAAAEATVCGQAVPFAPGSWVDLGQTAMVLSLQMGAPETGEEGSQGGSQPAAAAAPGPELLEIPYRTISACRISHSAAAGTATLALQLSELPEGLADQGFVPPPGAGGRPLLVLALRAVDLVQLRDAAPLVAGSIQRAGIALPAGEADLSQPGRSRKMSMAIAGRPLARPAAAAAPAAKGKAKGKGKAPVKTSVLEQMERARADSRQGNADEGGAAAAPPPPHQRQQAAPAAAKTDQAQHPGGKPRQWRTAKRDAAEEPAAAAAAAETPLGAAAEGLEDWMSQPLAQAHLRSPLVDASDSDSDGEFAGNEAYEAGAAAARGESPGAGAAQRPSKPATGPTAPYKNPYQQQPAAALQGEGGGGKAAGAARRPAAAAAPAAAKAKGKPAPKQLKAVAAGVNANAKPAKPAKAAAAVPPPLGGLRQTRNRAAAAKGAQGQAKARPELDDSDEEEMPPAGELEAPLAEDFGADDGADGGADGFDGGYGDGMDLDDLILSQRQDTFTASLERAEAAAEVAAPPKKAAAAPAAAPAERKQRTDAGAILGKHTPKGGAKKPRGGRMAALGGPGAQKTPGVAAALAAAAPAALAAPPTRTPAHLQTKTPAVDPGKKKDAGSDPVKPQKKKAAAAAPAAAAAAPRQKRAAAQKASKKLAERRSGADEDAEVVELAEGPGEEPWPAALSEDEEEEAVWGAEEDGGDAAEAEEEDAEEEPPLRKQPSPRRPQPRKKVAPAAPKAPARKAPPAKPQPTKAPVAEAAGRAQKSAPARAAAPPVPRPLAALEKAASDGESSEYSLHGSDTTSAVAAAAAAQRAPLPVVAGVGAGSRPLSRGRGAASSSSSDEDADDENEFIDAEEGAEEEDGPDGEAEGRYRLPAAAAQRLKKGKKEVAAAVQGVVDETRDHGLAQQEAFIEELKASAAARLEEARADAVTGVQEAEAAAAAALQGLAQARAAHEAAIAAAIRTFAAEMAGAERERAWLDAQEAEVMREARRGVGEARKRGKRRLDDAYLAVRGEVERGRKRVKEIIAEAVQEGHRAVLDMLNGVFFGVKQGG